MSDNGILRAELIRKLCKNSCSCCKLVEVLFDKDTRKRSNVAGKMEKMKLNPILINYIKSLAFQHFPKDEDENQASEWVQCQLNKAGRNVNVLDIL